MSDKFSSDDFLNLTKYQYDSKKEFSIDDILGITTPEIEPEIIPASIPEEKPTIIEESQIPEKEEEKSVLFVSTEAEEEPIVVADEPVFVVPEIEQEPTITLFNDTEPLIVEDDSVVSSADTVVAQAPEILVASDSTEKLDIISDGTPQYDLLIADDAENEEIVSEAQVDVEEKGNVLAAPSAPATSFTFNPAAFMDIKTKKENARQGGVITEQIEKAEATESDHKKDKREKFTSFPKKEKTKKTSLQSKTIEDAYDAEEREDMLADLRHLRGKITGKIVWISLLVLIQLYLWLGQFALLSFILPKQIHPISASTNYLLCTAAVTALLILFNISPLFDGFKKLFVGRMSSDGLSLMLGLFSLLYNAYFWLNPEKYTALNFDIIFGICVLFGLFAKRALVTNVYNGYELISDNELKTAVAAPHGQPRDNDVMVETGSGGDVVYATHTKVSSDFISRAFTEQNLNHGVDIFYFALYLALFLFGFTAWVFRLIPLDKLVVLGAALISISGAILSFWTHMLYIKAIGKVLRSHKTAITGTLGARVMQDSSVVVFADSELVNADDVALLEMNVLPGFTKEKLLPILSALFQTVGGPLDGFFDNICEAGQGSKSNVEQLYYEDGLGYTFLCDGQRIQVGNTEFMRQLKVGFPKAKNDDGNVLCIAVDNEAAAYFELTYKLGVAANRALGKLESLGFSAAIISYDLHLDEGFFADAVEDTDTVTVLSMDTANVCSSACGIQKNVKADIVTLSHSDGIACGFSAFRLLRENAVIHAAYKITASLFGIAAVLLITLFGKGELSLLPAQILGYQILWNIPSIIRAGKPKL